MDVLTAQRILGHADIKTTLSIYARLSAKKERSRSSRFGPLLTATKKESRQNRFLVG